VLFTHRFGQRHGDALREQLKLLGLYTLGLIWLVAMRGHKTETLKSDAASLDG
jgi:hypothetical protein